jgi:hypothetical protein
MYNFGDAMWFASGEESKDMYKKKLMMHNSYMYNMIFGCHVLDVFHVYFWL